MEAGFCGESNEFEACVRLTLLFQRVLIEDNIFMKSFKSDVWKLLEFKRTAADIDIGVLIRGTDLRCLSFLLLDDVRSLTAKENSRGIQH